MIKPYPDNWHRKLDFMPPMGLQVAAGAGNLELYYINSSVSIEEKSIPQVRRSADTEYGTIKVNPMFRNKVDYEMGSPQPRNGIVPVPQREILDDIMDGLGGAVKVVGDMPDVVIRSRGVVEKVPPQVEKMPAFQGADSVFYHQDAVGNYIHRVRRALGTRSIANPYRFMKSDLLRMRIITSTNDPVLRKLRSTLKTQYLITDATGWSDIGDAGVLAFERARMRWWTDIGQPTRFRIPMNHLGVEGQVYRLLRRDCLVAV